MNITQWLQPHLLADFGVKLFAAMSSKSLMYVFSCMYPGTNNHIYLKSETQQVTFNGNDRMKIHRIKDICSACVEVMVALIKVCAV